MNLNKATTHLQELTLAFGDQLKGQHQEKERLAEKLTRMVGCGSAFLESTTAQYREAIEMERALGFVVTDLSAELKDMKDRKGKFAEGSFTLDCFYWVNLLAEITDNFKSEHITSEAVHAVVQFTKNHLG